MSSTVQTPSAKISATLGMWIFLGSESLFFSGLFLALTIYRHLYPAAFSVGTQHLSLVLSTINTALLLTSSACVALALQQTRPQARRWLFVLTLLLGLLFLSLKLYEYVQHYREGLFPLLNWDSEENKNPQVELFFILYFIMTGLHALHMLIGLALISICTLRTKDPVWAVRHEALMENSGLYWHFVDVVWVFIFPLLYLIGRST